MSKKVQSKKEVKKVLEGSKSKEPKFKLISYTMKAVIPTGQYANIQPEVTVEAKTLEQAERAVMPYFETLFAKYRDGGVKPIEPVRPVMPQTVPKAPVASAETAQTPKVTPATAASPKAPGGSVSPNPASTPASVASTIVLTVPFTRAKGAIDSCTSLAALKLVSDQVDKSTKLVDSEKVELKKLAAIKLEQLNGKS